MKKIFIIAVIALAVASLGMNYMLPRQSIEQSMGKGDYVKLLIHSNTTDGSTTFTDSGVTGHTVTEVQGDGSVQHDTAQAKFGTTSMLFDGVNGYLTIATHADFDPQGGVFTFGCWFYLNGSGDTFTVWAMADGSGSNFSRLQIVESGGNITVHFRTDAGGAAHINFNTGALSGYTGGWHHLAIIRGWGNTWTDFAITLDGVFKAGATELGALEVAEPFEIGAFNGSGARTDFFDGWIDEARWTNGKAMWTKDFIPPRRPYN